MEKFEVDKLEDIFTEDGTIVMNPDRLLIIEDKIRNNIHSIKKNIVEIGKLLFIAKEKLHHGLFKKWIEVRFGEELPYSTANLYKNIYEQLVLHWGIKDEETRKALNDPSKPTNIKDKDFNYRSNFMVVSVINAFPISFLVHMTQKSFPVQVKELIYKATAICDEKKRPAYPFTIDANKLNTHTITDAFKDYKSKKIDLGEFKKRTKEEIEIGFKNKIKSRDEYVEKRRNENNFRRMEQAVIRISTSVWEIKKRYQELVDSGLLISKVNKDIQKRVNDEIKELKELSSLIGRVTKNKEKLLKV